MKRRTHTAIAFGLILTLAQPSVAQNNSASYPKSGLKTPVTNEGVVNDSAVAALMQMSTFLQRANTLRITSQGSLDVVTNDGQRIQLDGTTVYKIRRPGFVIDYSSDIKDRQFIYDGKTFTVYSPKLGYYATVAAPGTNKEVLDTIYNKFGISLPLEDLFRWDDASTMVRAQQFQSAYDVGPATIDGVETEHYAFREADVDWEIWIQQGDQPYPRKMVIVDRNDPARPTFIARLNWEYNPAFTDADFTFVPGPDAKKIQLASYTGSGG